jgi:hypothetical protein
VDEELNPRPEPVPEGGFLPEDVFQDYDVLPDDEILETGAVE